MLLIALVLCTAAVASTKSVHVGLLLPNTNLGTPLPGHSWKQVTCAAQLAVKHVNERQQLVVSNLRNLTANLTSITYSMYDTGYSASPAIVSYRRVRADGGVALVGAARSAVSTPLAQLGEVDKMPQCSYWSSSPSLSDTQLYPYCEPLQP